MRTIWKVLIGILALLGFVGFIILRPEKKHGRHDH